MSDSVLQPTVRPLREKLFMAKKYEYYLSIEKDPAIQVLSFAWINGSEKAFGKTGHIVGNELAITLPGDDMASLSRLISAAANHSIFSEIVLSMREVRGNDRWYKVVISYHFKYASCETIVPRSAPGDPKVLFYAELRSGDVSVR